MDPHKPIRRPTQYRQPATFRISPAFLVEFAVVLLIFSLVSHLALSILLDCHLGGHGWKILPFLYCVYLTRFFLEGYHIPPATDLSEETTLARLKSHSGIPRVVRKSTHRPKLFSDTDNDPQTNANTDDPQVRPACEKSSRAREGKKKNRRT
jgi:hypothetical protein